VTRGSGDEPSVHPHALITGGVGDLARAVSAELKTAGFTVNALSRSELDVTDTASIAAAFASLARLDLLVCCAGLTADHSMAALSEADFDLVLRANLTGSFRTARAALKLMARQRLGHIVFIGSFSALSGPAGQANYAAAKAGLIGLTQSLAREYGARNIRVNCIVPGFMETKMTAPLNDELRARFKEAHTLGRFNGPAEAARFIRFLHLEMPHTSAQVFNLDSRVRRWM
jgi:3-oxoacyl-[acyl-carrier protein] reductase